MNWYVQVCWDVTPPLLMKKGLTLPVKAWMLCQRGRYTGKGLGLRDCVPLRSTAPTDVSFQFQIRNATSKFYHTKWMVSSLVLLDSTLSQSAFITSEDAAGCAAEWGQGTQQVVCTSPLQDQALHMVPAVLLWLFLRGKVTSLIANCSLQWLQFESHCETSQNRGYFFIMFLNGRIKDFLSSNRDESQHSEKTPQKRCIFNKILSLKLPE